MAHYSRVCSQQSSSHSNQGLTIYSKLWERTMDGNRYQKEEKDKDSSKVCRNNEKDTEETETALKRAQEEMKQQADKRWKKEKA